MKRMVSGALMLGVVGVGLSACSIGGQSAGSESKSPQASSSAKADSSDANGRQTTGVFVKPAVGTVGSSYDAAIVPLGAKVSVVEKTSGDKTDIQMKVTGVKQGTNFKADVMTGFCSVMSKTIHEPKATTVTTGNFTSDAKGGGGLEVKGAELKSNEQYSVLLTAGDRKAGCVNLGR